MMPYKRLFLFGVLLCALSSCAGVPTQSATTQSPTITQHITVIENSSITGADVAGLNITQQDEAPTQSLTEEKGKNNWIFYTIALIVAIVLGYFSLKKIKKGI